jgi:thymidylate synthase (FAD)
MKIIKPSIEILDDLNLEAILKKLELCGRVCYKSEDKITPESAAKFISSILKRGHESVIEHFSFSVKFIVDRGVSHEMVRHRLASYSQESTRYCNYAKNRFGREITVIEPIFLKRGTQGYDIWKQACEKAEQAYFGMLDWGCLPEEARDVLPTCVKTEIVMTANLREWRHFLRLRTSPAAHPQIREVAKMLLDELTLKLPVLFDDI